MLRSFFNRVIAIGIVLHLYVGIRLIPVIPAPVVVHVLMWLWLVFSCLIIPMGMRRRDGATRGASGSATTALIPVVVWIGLLEMGLFSFLLTLTVIRDACLIVYALISAVAPALTETMPFDETEKISAVIVPILAVAMTCLGIYNARRRAPIVKVDVPINGLPAGLHGFTIAQLSDIHVGPTIKKRYLDPIVDAVNRLDADMVAITGDLVDGSVPALRAHTQPLSRLKGRHGVFVCTGNHEYYAGADAWVTEFRRLGLTVLMNQHVVLTHKGEKLVLGGVTDFGASHYNEKHRSDPKRALAGAPLDAVVRILLAHQPRSAKAAEDAGFTFQLSGHTHGGQFFPWNFAVKTQQPFVAGLVKTGNMLMYISRGTGYWGPPVRLAAPSEITYLRLVPGKAM